jgi:hypothetical protein
VLNLENAKMCLKHHPFEKRRPIFEMQRCIEKHYHIWFFGLESFPCTQMVFCIHSYQNLLFWPSNESSIITEKPGNVSFISNILQIGQKNNVHQCLVVWTGTSKNTLLSRWMKVEGHIYRSIFFILCFSVSSK